MMVLKFLIFVLIIISIGSFLLSFYHGDDIAHGIEETLTEYFSDTRDKKVRR